MSDQTPVAPSPAPDNLDWFRALTTSPASEAPAAPVEPVPDPAAVPTPEPPVVAAEPDAPPAPEIQPVVDPELEALKRQVADLNTEREERRRQDADRVRAEADAQREADLSSYWDEVERNADRIDDEAERKAYYRKAKDDLVRQESAYHQEQIAQRELTSAVQNFPDHIGKEWELTPDQITELRTFAENPNPVVAGQLMAGAAMAYRKMNQTPTNPVLREQAIQAVADKAAAAAAASGVTNMGGITGANPTPAQPPPTALRPGSPESLNMLAGALSALNQR